MSKATVGAQRCGGLGIWAKLYALRSVTGDVEATYPDRPPGSSNSLAIDAAPVASADVNAAPMASADLVFGSDGRVAWDQIWGDFCALALIGGPPHRGSMLDAPTVEVVAANLSGYEQVRDELERGIALTTHWPVERDGPIGWIGLICPDREAAICMTRAILAENVAARSAGAIVFVPAGPAFELKGEIKNVVTAVAKAWHYWAKHGMRWGDGIPTSAG